MSGAVGGWGALRASPDHVISLSRSGSSPDESPVVPAVRRHFKRGFGGEGVGASGPGSLEEGSAQADSDSGSLWVL